MLALRVQFHGKLHKRYQSGGNSTEIGQNHQAYSRLSLDMINKKSTMLTQICLLTELNMWFWGPANTGVNVIAELNTIIIDLNVRVVCCGFQYSAKK